MDSILEFVRYATGNGFWVFLGVIVILTIVGEAVSAVLASILLSFKR